MLGCVALGQKAYFVKNVSKRKTFKTVENSFCVLPIQAVPNSFYCFQQTRVFAKKNVFFRLLLFKCFCLRHGGNFRLVFYGRLFVCSYPIRFRPSNKFWKKFGHFETFFKGRIARVRLFSTSACELFLTSV